MVRPHGTSLDGGGNPRPDWPKRAVGKAETQEYPAQKVHTPNDREFFQGNQVDGWTAICLCDDSLLANLPGAGDLAPHGAAHGISRQRNAASWIGILDEKVQGVELRHSGYKA